MVRPTRDETFAAPFEELSDYSKAREEYMRTLQVPTMSVISAQHGESLAQVMFEDCSDALKPLLGLAPRLEGPGGRLWTSPSDLLLGKVCLKPPLTSKLMQALTHQGILEIGLKIEQKFLDEMELEKRNALEEQERVLRYMFEKEKARAVQAAVEEQKLICSEMIAQLRSEFEEKLQQLLEEPTKPRSPPSEPPSSILDDPEDEERNREWKEKRNAAVMYAVKLVTKAFLEDLERQKRTLVQHFEGVVKRAKIKCSFRLMAERDRHREILRQFKHYLECKNIANMMYVLCMERRKCQAERETLEHAHRKEVEQLKMEAQDMHLQIETLQTKLELEKKRLEQREFYLLQVLKQFQKFINFVLGAAPTQAEFLLNIEHMMSFEIKEASERAAAKAETVQPWNDSSKASTSVGGLVMNDYHCCCRQVDFDSDDDSQAERPIFYYNDKMYVREDFRNMLSQGIEVTPDDLLWNKDVEKLINLMKESVEEKEKDSVLVHVINDEAFRGRISVSEEAKSVDKEELAHGETVSDIMNIYSVASKTPSKTNVRFDPKPCELKEDKETITLPTDSLKSALSKRFYPVPEFIDHSSVGTVEQRPTVLGSKDSLELIMKTRLGRKWRKKQHITRQRCDDFTQTSEAELMTTFLEHGEEKSPSSVDLFPKKCKPRRKHKPAQVEKVKIVTEPRKTSDDTKPLKTGLEIVREAIEARKREEKGLRDSLEIHRKSLVPKIEMKAPEDDGLEELRKSRLSVSKDSLVLARESLEVKKIIKKAQESKLSLARDSLEILKQKPSSTSIVRIPSVSQEKLPADSKLSLARDSLEILRTSTEKVIDATPSKLELAKDSIELLKGISRQSVETPKEPTAVIRLDDEDAARSVKMSHVEILEVGGEQMRSRVSFYPQPQVIDAGLRGQRDAPEDIYGKRADWKSDKKGKRDKFLQKPNKLEVVGNRDAKEHLQKRDEFVLHRINSIMGMLRENPSLVRIFTSVTR